MKIMNSICIAVLAVLLPLGACGETRGADAERKAYGKVEAGDLDTENMRIIGDITGTNEGEGANETIVFARINSEGYLELADEAAPETQGSRVSDWLIADDDGPGGIHLDNVDAEWIHAELFASGSDGGKYRVIGAQRVDAARWRNGDAPDGLKDGDVLADWYYVTQPVRITGRYDYAEGNHFEADMDLKPGWNLILRIVEDAAEKEEGGPYIRSERMESFKETSPELGWYVLEVPD